MIIIKVYHLKRTDNKLIGFFKATPRDFDEKVEARETTYYPNEFFYRKFRKQTGIKWDNDFGYRIISIPDATDLVERFKRKQDFYAKQVNSLQTLIDL